MKTTWDYTTLAEAYLKRPPYSPQAIDAMVELADLKPGSKVCDVGAGVGHLTLELSARGFQVVAVEPNDAMRQRGKARCESSVIWHEATGEATGQPSDAFDLVTFGSSFNVTDRDKALQESWRILKAGGWFACMWNHRNLEDPVQAKIESLIQQAIPEYDYGVRRQDQSDVINACGLFETTHKIEASVKHVQPIQDVIEAWRSHATLERQAGDKFAELVTTLEKYLTGLHRETLEIPYTTRLWCARSKKS